MTTTTTPHDALFKAAFSLPDNAAAELRHVLGPEIAALIDFSSLTLRPGSFVSEALRARHADLLFTANVADHEIQIYVLCEHQSTPDPWMQLWLMGYMQQIWEAFVTANPRARTLPLIIPVVVAHSDTGWHGSTEFAALFAIPEAASALRAFVPNFRFALDDLAGQDAAAIHRRDASPFARLALLALQQARRTRDLGRIVRGWLDLLKELRRQPGGARAYDQLIQYLLQVCGPDAYAVQTTATEIDPETRRAMETFAEMWQRQGRERGLQEGECGLLLRMLRRRFGELPATVVSRVQAADAASLERWADRLLEAHSLDEVFTAA